MKPISDKLFFGRMWTSSPTVISDNRSSRSGIIVILQSGLLSVWEILFLYSHFFFLKYQMSQMTIARLTKITAG